MPYLLWYIHKHGSLAILSPMEQQKIDKLYTSYSWPRSVVDSHINYAQDCPSAPDKGHMVAYITEWELFHYFESYI